MKTATVAPATTPDYRALAEKRLPRFLFDYIDGGSNQELTLAANTRDFENLLLRQRILRDVSAVDTSTRLLGQSASMPLILAPVGMAGMMARRGEVQGLGAANAAGIPFTLSTLGVCTLEELAQTSDRPFWFQLYMLRDRKAVASLLDRAANAGCNTLVFTVDLAVTGMRHRDTRNGMIGSKPLAMALGKARQLAVRPRWIYDVALMGRPLSIGNLDHLVPDPTDLNAYKNWIDSQFDPTVNWKDIAWLRDIWPGKLILKGILDIDDALSACEVGADAIVVSNHGGRQLDAVASTISRLPGIADAVGEKLEVYLDGGVRNGIDVIKAVAQGAKGVLIGRPWVWAVAGAGKPGLVDLLTTFRQEMETAMALMGIDGVDQLHPDLLEPAGPAAMRDPQNKSDNQPKGRSDHERQTQ